MTKLTLEKIKASTERLLAGKPTKKDLKGFQNGWLMVGLKPKGTYPDAELMELTCLKINGMSCKQYADGFVEEVKRRLGKSGRANKRYIG